MSLLSVLEPAPFLSTINCPDVAKPKSPILTLFKPSGVTAMKMFSGFRSRWTIFSPCICTKPSRTWRNSLHTSSVSLYIFRDIKSRNVCRSQFLSNLTLQSGSRGVQMTEMCYLPASRNIPLICKAQSGTVSYFPSGAGDLREVLRLYPQLRSLLPS